MSMFLEKLNSIIIKSEDGNMPSKVYDMFMLATILASVTPLMFHGTTSLFKIIESVTVTIFIFDYIARWCTSSIRMKKGVMSFIMYPFTPMAIIDLLSIIPATNLLNSSFKLFRLTRLFKVVRLFKAFRYSKRIEMLGRVLYRERHVLISVLLLSVVYIFVTALIMFNVEPQFNPITGETTFKSFFDALYWASVTLTTVGYGDICPVTDMGRVVSIVSSLFGVAIIALPSGVITASYLDELKNNRKESNFEL